MYDNQFENGYFALRISNTTLEKFHMMDRIKNHADNNQGALLPVEKPLIKLIDHLPILKTSLPPAMISSNVIQFLVNITPLSTAFLTYMF